MIYAQKLTTTGCKDRLWTMDRGFSAGGKRLFLKAHGLFKNVMTTKRKRGYIFPVKSARGPYLIDLPIHRCRLQQIAATHAIA
jgi:hypothetical protein